MATVNLLLDRGGYDPLPPVRMPEGGEGVAVLLLLLVVLFVIIIKSERSGPWDN